MPKKFIHTYILPPIASEAKKIVLQDEREFFTEFVSKMATEACKAA